MNEMNDLERHLRSWAPRRPSARLEQKLFGQPADPGEEQPIRWRMSWLAPATAAALLTFVLLNQHPSQALHGSSGSSSMVAMILSNRSATAYLPISYTVGQNGLPRETFEYTISTSSNSSISPLPSSGGTD